MFERETQPAVGTGHDRDPIGRSKNRWNKSLFQLKQAKRLATNFTNFTNAEPTSQFNDVSTWNFKIPSTLLQESFWSARRVASLTKQIPRVV